MTRPPHISDRIELLLLERRLLMDGKLVPDAGSSGKHIEQRLHQIVQELRACLDAEDATELPHDRDGVLDWGTQHSWNQTGRSRKVNYEAEVATWLAGCHRSRPA